MKNKAGGPVVQSTRTAPVRQGGDHLSYGGPIKGPYVRVVGDTNPRRPSVQRTSGQASLRQLDLFAPPPRKVANIVPRKKRAPRKPIADTAVPVCQAGPWGAVFQLMPGEGELADKLYGHHLHGRRVSGEEG
jgi:hypothetical protein